MKQFDLQEYLKNPDKKIITRDGRSVRIICTDRKSDNFPIVGLVKGIQQENIGGYTKDGEYSHGIESSCDLFFAPEKIIGWINLYKDKDDIVTDKFIFHSKEDARIQRDIHKDSYIATIKIEWEE